MGIRAAQVTDLAAIERLYSAGLRQALKGQGATHPIRLWQILTRTLTSLFPLAASSELLYVLEDGGRVRGFIQGELLSVGSAPVRRSPEAVRVLNIALSPELPGSAGGSLIDHLCNEALERGAARVYVRIPEGHAASEAFKAQNFHAYAHDRVFFRDALPEPEGDGDPAQLRSARRSDLLGLFTLYLAATPRQVSQAEAPEFDQWRAVFEREWFGRFFERPARGLVLDRGEIDGWLGIEPAAGGRPHTIAMLSRSGPSELELPRQLLREALRRLQPNPGAIWCNVRNYDTATSRVLQDAGFRSLAGQDLLVREMRAREPARARGRKKEKVLAPAFG